MESTELRQLMAEYNKKLDEVIHLNKESALKQLNIKKSKKATMTLLIYRVIEMSFYGFLVIYLGWFIAVNWNDGHLAISGIIIDIFAIIALVGSIGQVVLLNQISYDQPIIEIRKKIELVNAHGFLFLKLVLFSIPVWWAYAIVGLEIIFGFDIYPHLNPTFVYQYLIFNFLLIIPLLWFLKKISYKNLHLRWVKKTIELLTTTKTKKALNALKDIEAFEKK